MAILVDEKKLEGLLWDLCMEAFEWPHDFSIPNEIDKIIEECKKVVDKPAPS